MRSCIMYLFGAIMLVVLTSCGGAMQKGTTGEDKIKNNPNLQSENSMPDTVEPSNTSPTIKGERYEMSNAPDSDPDGWTFGNRRASDDKKDAKKKPFDIDAIYKYKNVFSPVFSPDGKRILFGVVSYVLEKGKGDVNIFVVNTDGTGLRELTHFEGLDASPIWAPDGKSFMFVSTRKEGSQVWIMPIDGGEARQLTSISTGVDHPIWSPDGKKIAFASSVYPRFGADDAKNKQALEKRTKNPIQAHLADDLLYRHWTSYSDGKRSHIMVIDVDSKEVIDVTPGDFESPVFSLGGVGFTFSPDGKEICFVSNREKGSAQAWTTNADLWVVPTTGGKTINITKANKAWDGHPAYSYDGKYIAFLRQEKPGYESDKKRIAIYDRKTGKTEILTEGFDNTIYDLKWAKDDISIYFQVPDKGHFPLMKLTVRDAKIEKVAHIPQVREFDVSKDGNLVFTYNTVSDPIELFVTSLSKGVTTRVTGFNRELVAQYDMRPVEEIWFDGANGKKVHGFIVKPHGYKKGKKYPTILNVHGGPQMQWSDTFRANWQIFPGSGYVMVFINPHGSTGYGQEYTAAISGDYSGKVATDVLMVIDAVGKLDYVNEDKMGAMGWSWGGFMMGWLLGHTDKLKAIVSMMAMYDMNSFFGATEELWFPEWDSPGIPWENAEEYKKNSPSSFADNFKTPTLVITGEKDYRCPYTQSLQMFTALRRQGVPARLIVFPNDGHWPSFAKSMPLYYAAHLDWFHRYLGGKQSPYDVEELVEGIAFDNKTTK